MIIGLILLIGFAVLIRILRRKRNAFLTKTGRRILNLWNTLYAIYFVVLMSVFVVVLTLLSGWKS